MKSTLAAQLFAVLTDKERARLGKFLRSPYFNRRGDIIDLYEWLKTQPCPLPESATREEVWAKIYPGQPFDRRQFNYLVNFLAERIEQFWAEEELQADRFQQRLLRCRAFRQRGLVAHFDTNARELARDHAASPLRNAGWWLFEYQLQNEMFARLTMERRSGPTNLGAATEALAHFFLLENLRWSATARSFQSLAREAQPPVPLSAEALNAAADSQHPALALTHAALAAQADPDNEIQYRRLKNLLHEHVGLFPPAEGRDLYMTAINFAIRRHNRGERTYTREAFELYREALDSGLLTDNGLLPKYTYINLLNLAQLTGEHSWARDFLERGRALLPPGERDNTWRYAQAGFHFRRSEYEPVLELLRAVDFSEIFIQLDARKLLSRSYYELGEWQALASLLDSFKAYLRRQKELGYHRDSYLNFARFTNRLMKVAGQKKAQRRQLAVRIQAAGSVAEREWLLEKLKI
ncbi:MAG: hypothetical protein IT259_20070 [Saprospiraceae bacterium]|nr:hypothetical protein [Saprospiraceae bacterium]